MIVTTKLEKLKAASQLIALKATGNPQAFARRLRISESTLYRLLKDMKEMGAKIVYNRSRLSYEFPEGEIFYVGMIRETELR